MADSEDDFGDPSLDGGWEDRKQARPLHPKVDNGQAFESGDGPLVEGELDRGDEADHADGSALQYGCDLQRRLRHGNVDNTSVRERDRKRWWG